MTHRFKLFHRWETSNSLLLSIWYEVLLFSKNRLSESKLNLILAIKLIDDPQNLIHFSSENLESLWYRTNVAWIGELIQILVAEIVVVLEKCAAMHYKENSLNKVSPLGLIKVIYYSPVMGINSRKAYLPNITQSSNLNRAQRVQDVHQEILNVYPNWTSQHRSYIDTVQGRNPEWKPEDHKRIRDMILHDLQKGIWPLYNLEIKI